MPRRAAERATHAVYIWQWPVRIVHWTIVVTLAVMSFTGYYLFDPFLEGSGGAGHPGFTRGTMLAVHETAGFVFTAAVLLRIYWAFAGNRYARWRALLPLTAAQRRDLREMILYYALVRRRPPRADGHNPLAGLAYVAVYALFALAILSGFGLLAWVSRIPAWRSAFGWTYDDVLPIQDLRLLHFMLMFIFGAFTIHHVYSSVLIDHEERNGELSSIASGYKSVPIDEPEAESDREPATA